MDAKEAVDEILQGNIPDFHRYVASLGYSEIEGLLLSILDLPAMDQDYSDTPEYRIVKEAMTPFFPILRGISENIEADREELQRQHLINAEEYIEDLELTNKGFSVYHAYTTGFSAIKIVRNQEVTLNVKYKPVYKASIINKNTEKEYFSAEELKDALSKI